MLAWHLSVIMRQFCLFFMMQEFIMWQFSVEYFLLHDSGNYHVAVFSWIFSSSWCKNFYFYTALALMVFVIPLHAFTSFSAGLVPLLSSYRICEGDFDWGREGGLWFIYTLWPYQLWSFLMLQYYGKQENTVSSSYPRQWYKYSKAQHQFYVAADGCHKNLHTHYPRRDSMYSCASTYYNHHDRIIIGLWNCGWRILVRFFSNN